MEALVTGIVSFVIVGYIIYLFREAYKEWRLMREALERCYLSEKVKDQWKMREAMERGYRGGKEKNQ